MNAPYSLAKKLWIAVRFMIFGFVGFWVLIGFTLAFAMRVFENDRDFVTPFLSMPLAVVGAFMMLFGVGEWGRWGYLLVFLSIPVAFIGTIFVYDTMFPHSGKSLEPFVVTAIAAFVTLAGVRGYYERLARGRARKESHDDTTV